MANIKTIGDLKEYLQRLIETLSCNYEDSDEISTSASSYGMRPYFLSTPDGFINLDEPANLSSSEAMVSYYIFKHDNLTGKETHISNGSYDTMLECRSHFRAYLFGFMDAMSETVGAGNYRMLTVSGHGDLSFRLLEEGKTDLVYYMLFGKAGRNHIYKISNE